MSHKKTVQLGSTRLLADRADIITQLQEHEASALDAPSADDITPELVAAMRTTEDLNTARQNLERERKALEAERLALVRRQRIESLRAKCSPLKIGGRDGISPDSLDIRVEEHPRSDGQPPDQIAWIPVPVWPIPKPPDDPARRFYTRTAPDGTVLKTPNYDLGKTSVVESLATVLVTTTELLPDGTFRKVPVSIRAFAGITLNPATPEEVAERITRRDSRHTLETVSQESDIAGEGSDLLDPEAAVPAFTPSQASRSRGSRQ